MLRDDSLSKKIAATISALFLLCFVSACDTRELTSDAFALGKETGTTWRELSTEIEIISSWATDVGETVDIPKVEKEKACQGMWLLVVMHPSMKSVRFFDIFSSPNVGQPTRSHIP